MAIKVGQQIELELMHVTGDGKGVAWGPEDKLILIDQVDEDDSTVTVKIEKILEEAVLAKKITGMKQVKQPKSRDAVDSPYEMDDDTTEDYEDED